MMEDINKFMVFNRLKSVYRAGSVDDRKESAAEHSWSSLVLADFFLSQTDMDINRLKVYELLMYHDVIEIETGDNPLSPVNEQTISAETEKKALAVLKTKLPPQLGTKFADLFQEFSEQKTVEARFARAIDALDAEIHELDYKQDWDSWTKEFLVKHKSHLFRDFPELNKAFEDILVYLTENNYFSGIHNN